MTEETTAKSRNRPRPGIGWIARGTALLARIGADARDDEELRRKKAYYGSPELGWIIEMVAYDVSVNVVFFGGAEFDPPPPLGTTERARYVKVKTLEEVQAPEMSKWIEQAGRVPGWR